MPWYLYLALKQLFPSGKRFPIFTVISVAGVALGVMVLIVTTSVMGGFHYELRQMIVDSQGEVQIQSHGLMANYPAVVKRVESVPGVVAATPYAGTSVMLQYQGRPVYPLLSGIDPASIERVTNLRKYMTSGSLDDLDDDSVILGRALSDSLGATVGDEIEIYSPLAIQKYNSSGEIFLPRSVKVVGIIEFGHQQLDTSTVYCTLRLAQDLFGLDSAVHGLYVRLAPGLNEDEGAARINAALLSDRSLPRDLRARSWEDVWSDFLWILNLEKSMIFFMLFIIVIVAAFSVTSSLLISVIRKTREIGLLGALGARPRDVAACFCIQGLFIGVLGTAVGLGLGFGALAIRNDVVMGIARATQRADVLRRFYQFSELPAHTAGSDVVKTVILTILVSILAGLLPAWRAARLKPVEALRNE
jgi:lipoprotein-releasing system permease protein